MGTRLTLARATLPQRSKKLGCLVITGLRIGVLRFDNAVWERYLERIVRSCGRLDSAAPNPGVGLGGLAPSAGNIALGGLPLTDDDHLLDFSLHGPRMKLAAFRLPY